MMERLAPGTEVTSQTSSSRRVVYLTQSRKIYQEYTSSVQIKQTPTVAARTTANGETRRNRVFLQPSAPLSHPIKALTMAFWRSLQTVKAISKIQTDHLALQLQTALLIYCYYHLCLVVICSFYFHRRLYMSSRHSSACGDLPILNPYTSATSHVFRTLQNADSATNRFPDWPIKRSRDVSSSLFTVKRTLLYLKLRLHLTLFTKLGNHIECKDTHPTS